MNFTYKFREDGALEQYDGENLRATVAAKDIEEFRKTWPEAPASEKEITYYKP